MVYSFFERVALAPADAIFQLTIAFMEDPRPHKVNLSVGLYRDEKLETPVLKTVKAAEKYLLSHEMTKEYLPISGDPVYIEESGRLIFGNELWKEHHGKICGMQTPGGTGALRVGGDFVRKEAADTIAIPEPTWPNHPGVFKQCGFKIHPYSYYDLKKEQLDSDAIFEMLKKIPEKSAVLFHACCHNPTGADLIKEEWEKAAEIVKKRELLPFFDFAYQGFGKGIDKDAFAIRLFVKKSIECVVASSYSKNFGLYSERVGSVFVVTSSEDAAKNVLSKIKIFARTSYSNPPKHGAAVVAHILSNAELKQEWAKEVDAMRHRLEALRKEFVAALQTGQKKRDFSYLLKRVGMFCYLGLDKEKVSRLRDEYGIYMAEGGRMNLAGLSRGNFNYVIQSMIKVL
jgi:aspartate/tyrosine/aromatic aminotransferase